MRSSLTWGFASGSGPASPAPPLAAPAAARPICDGRRFFAGTGWDGRRTPSTASGQPGFEDDGEAGRAGVTGACGGSFAGIGGGLPGVEVTGSRTWGFGESSEGE